MIFISVLNLRMKPFQKCIFFFFSFTPSYLTYEGLFYRYYFNQGEEVVSFSGAAKKKKSTQANSIGHQDSDSKVQS